MPYISYAPKWVTSTTLGTDCLEWNYNDSITYTPPKTNENLNIKIDAIPKYPEINFETGWKIYRINNKIHVIYVDKFLAMYNRIKYYTYPTVEEPVKYITYTSSSTSDLPLTITL